MADANEQLSDELRDLADKMGQTGGAAADVIKSLMPSIMAHMIDMLLVFQEKTMDGIILAQQKIMKKKKQLLRSIKRCLNNCVNYGNTLPITSMFRRILFFLMPHCVNLPQNCLPMSLLSVRFQA